MVAPPPRLNRSIKECFDLLRSDAPVSLNESNDFALSVGVMLYIYGSGAEACVSSQHLDITQAAANLADPPRCARDERPPSAMARAARHSEPGIQPVKPYSDRCRRQTLVALAVDDRPIWTRLDTSLLMECHERGLKVRMNGNSAAPAFPL
jgi:hypothetical protein